MKTLMKKHFRRDSQHKEVKLGMKDGCFNLLSLLSPALGTCECSPPDTGRTSSLQQPAPPPLESPGSCRHHRAWRVQGGNPTRAESQHISQVACILVYIRNIAATNTVFCCSWNKRSTFSLGQQGVCDSAELQAHKPAARLQDPQRLLQCLTGNPSRTYRVKNNSWDHNIYTK